MDTADNQKEGNDSPRYEFRESQLVIGYRIEMGHFLDWLPEKLREVAILRKEHPDLSIAALGELCDPPLKKSGINGRFKKIEEIAAKL